MKPVKVFQPGALAPGEYWGKCDVCACVMVKRWDDGPGPDLCGQDCYDDYVSRPYIPLWATDG
jgi:hypothetical protein